MSIGRRIKMLRESQGMTLDEVARKCKTIKQTIYKYENEIVTNIPYDKIELLAKAFDVSPSYLFGWKESSPDKLQLTEGEKELLNLFRRVPEEHQQMVLQMIRVALSSQ